MKERLIYDTLIIDQSFLYGGNYEKGSYYCIYNVFIRNDFFISICVFFEPVEVFNKAIVVAILIIAFIICCLYRKNKKRR